MRFPRISELDEKQLDVYNAPLNGATLVIGPPGSGKTVLAFFRAIALVKSNSPYKVLMYNRVLSKYTHGSRIADVDKKIETQTMDAWRKEWWEKVTDTKIPSLPAEEGSYYKPADHMGMITQLAKRKNNEQLDWGHLIIDEGQDFSQDLYYLLGFCREHCFKEREISKRPSLTILADENQRITDSNSTLNQIREASKTDNNFSLEKNYRNTRQIAEFANCFFVGIESGTGELSEKEGDPPQITSLEDTRDTVKAISRYIKNHDNEEIAVFLPYKNLVKKYVNRLRSQLEDLPNVIVQAYISGDKNFNSDKLVFDQKGTVTVLCLASAKGLEFDTVFLPELQCGRRDDANMDIFKMNHYVACTRARKSLFLMYCGKKEDFLKQDVGRWLPGPDRGLATWNS